MGNACEFYCEDYQFIYILERKMQSAGVADPSFPRVFAKKKEEKKHFKTFTMSQLAKKPVRHWLQAGQKTR